MSYSIIYRSLFIKFPNNTYLPFVEYGDNNVYDVLPSGKCGKRSRDWGICGTIFVPTKNMPATEEEMLNNLDRIHQQQIERAKEYNERNPESKWDYAADGKDFGSYMGLKLGSNYASLKQFKNFVKNGCKKAVLFENLKSNSISITIQSSWYLKIDHPDMKSFHHYVETPEQYVSLLKKPQIILEGLISTRLLDFLHLNGLSPAYLQKSPLEGLKKTRIPLKKVGW